MASVYMLFKRANLKNNYNLKTTLQMGLFKAFTTIWAMSTANIFLNEIKTPNIYIFRCLVMFVYSHVSCNANPYSYIKIENHQICRCGK